MFTIYREKSVPTYDTIEEMTIYMFKNLELSSGREVWRVDL